MTEKMNASQTPQATQNPGASTVHPQAPAKRKRTRKARMVQDRTPAAAQDVCARGPVKPPKSAGKEKPHKALVNNKPADTR